jgi:hypothetical protein
MNGVYNNRRNGHKATTDGITWTCSCGRRGVQKDDQYAMLAAGFHVRHPERPIPATY